MSSLRGKILAAIAKAPYSTAEDLEMAIGDMAKKQLSDNIKECVKSGLAERHKDDVTGLPCYKLTTGGEAWLINRPDQPAPAGGGQRSSKNTGSKRGAILSAPPVTALAVEQPVPTTSVRAETGAGNEIDSLHKTHIDFCEWLHRTARTERMPINMHECKQVIENMIEDHVEREGRAARQAEPLGYSVMLEDETCASIDDAMAMAVNDFSGEDLDRVRIVAVMPVARIAVKPVLVMEAS